MHTEPIQRGAKCPQGRPRHALLSVLVRLAAIAGFAFAGWLALSALTHSAFAAERPTRPATGPGTARNDPGLIGRAPRVGPLDAASALRSLTTAPAHRHGRPHRDTQARPHDQVRQDGRPREGAQVREGGRVREGGQVRHGGPVRRSEALVGGGSEGVSRVLPGSVPQEVSGGVREIGEQPVRYLRARQQDLLDGKDRAVGQVRDVAGEAGVPGAGVADLLQGRPVIGGLVHRVTDQQPLLDDGATAAAQQGPQARHDSGRARDGAAPAAESRARHAAVRLPAAAGGPARDSADPCSGCRGGHHTPSPGPALPSGQDTPRGGGPAGGQPFAPVADLLHRGHPAAPSAADPGTFRRTALRDVAAPGGPSVVPD